MTLTIDHKPTYSVLGKIMDKLTIRKALENFSKREVQKAKLILEANQRVSVAAGSTFTK